MDLDKKAAELKTSKTPFCWLTITKSEGSAPRHAGSKMIVTADGEGFGTIGGGGVEHEAEKHVSEVLRRKNPECITYDLSEDGIQPCGGKTEVFFEPVFPREEMIVFGAGHIAKKLIPMLLELDYDVTLVDERKDRHDLESFDNVTKKISELPSNYLPKIKFSKNLSIICLTHKHIYDEKIIEYCLDKPLNYLGLISSRKKWQLFCSHYEEKGFTKEQMNRVSTPIGLDIGGESPFEIAVAIAAQLIQMRARPDDFKKGTGHFK